MNKTSPLPIRRNKIGKDAVIKEKVEIEEKVERVEPQK